MKILKILSISLSVLIVGACSFGGSNDSGTSSSSFTFTKPATGALVAGNISQPIVLTWLSGGNPVAGRSVTFATTFGSLTDGKGGAGASLTATSGADGTVQLQIVSSSAGMATVTASATDPASGTFLTSNLALTFLGAPSTLTAAAASPIAANATSVVTAVVKDANAALLPGVTVGFMLNSANTGVLSAASAVTDASGTASVVFTPKGFAETATVTVSAPGLTSQTVTIQVTQSGSTKPAGTLSFSPCPSAVPQSSSASCTVILVDGNGQPLAGTTINVAATAGTVTPASGMTAADGTFAFSLAVPAATMGSTSPATSTLTATATVSNTSVTQTYAVTLKPASFAFTSPAAKSTVTTNVKAPLALLWTAGGSAVMGGTVTFSTSQGNLVDSTNNLGTSLAEKTGSDGTAGVSLVASSTGAVTVTATAPDSGSGAQYSTTLSLTAVGPPSSLTATAPTPIPSNGSSVITATVKDSAGDLLSGVSVSFALQGGGGTLSAAMASTDSNGTARSLFSPDGTSNSATVTVSSSSLTSQTVTIAIGTSGGGTTGGTSTGGTTFGSSTTGGTTTGGSTTGGSSTGGTTGGTTTTGGGTTGSTTGTTTGGTTG